MFSYTQKRCKNNRRPLLVILIYFQIILKRSLNHFNRIYTSKPFNLSEIPGNLGNVNTSKIKCFTIVDVLRVNWG